MSEDTQRGLREASGSQPDRFTLQGVGSEAEADISALREGFKQGFVFELIDRNFAQTSSQVHVLCVNPTQYTLTEPFQLTLTPAEDDTVVAEENGQIVREITIEGTTGIAEKRARGFLGSQGGGNPLSGIEHFQELRNLFRRYSRLKKDPRRAANIQLILHVLRDGDAFVVAPREFVTPRDAGKTRTHYDYRISLAVLSDAVTTDLRRTEIEPDVGAKITNKIRDISEAFNDARAAITEITSNLSDIRRRIGNVNAAVNGAIQVVNATGAFLAGTAELINYPLQLAASVAEQVADAADRLVQSVENATFGVVHENARSFRRLEAAIDRLIQFDDQFSDLFSRTEKRFGGETLSTREDVADLPSGAAASAPGPGGATLGTRTRVTAGASGREAGLSVPRGTGYRGVTVTRTDSLESIASEAGTTPEAILLINNLQPPYITAAGGPGILRPGDVVLVPAAVGSGLTEGRGVNDYLTPEDALYGVDLALDSVDLNASGTFDLLVDGINNTGDWAVIRGIANVVQGTEITIGTELGTTVFLPTLGIRRNVGSKGTTQHVLLASITLREALLQDPRISAIESSRVVFDSSTGELTQEITPVVSGQRSGATFVLPFGRATGG